MKEHIVIIITMILNLIVAIIKLLAGILFSFSTLISDSIQSFMDFITDIIALVATKIGKRRANKIYPFGYGQVYSIANLFTGALLFLIGIYILCQVFFFKGELNIRIELFIAMIAVIIIKSIVVFLLRHYGKNNKSEIMIESSKESFADLISTFVVIIVSILAIIIKKLNLNIDVDKIGSLGIAIYVFYIAIKMIVYNIKEVLINAEENKDIDEDVREELEKIKQIDLKQLRVIKMSTYYSVFIKVKVEEKLTIRQYIKLEKKIKENLRSKNKTIRFIDIEPV